ncbi:MAG: hypothetical protein ACFB0G_20625, partial [Leptolyngbyaceae cyanobacterium]
SEMNPIEGEWQHLKRDELRGQMFESEAELAYHVVEGLEHRGEIHGHTTQYVNVKTTYPTVVHLDLLCRTYLWNQGFSLNPP